MENISLSLTIPLQFIECPSVPFFGEITLMCDWYAFKKLSYALNIQKQFDSANIIPMALLCEINLLHFPIGCTIFFQ